MDTALPQKFPFILDRNLAKANCTGNPVCTSCDIVVLARAPFSHHVGADAGGLAEHVLALLGGIEEFASQCQLQLILYQLVTSGTVL